MSGTLYGLGVGPGDPGLLTLKAHAILRAVPVIAYIRAKRKTGEGESLARAIAAPHLPGGQVEIPFDIPMSSDPRVGQAVFDERMPRVAAHLEAGRDVAVLCEGDPLFHGSFISFMDRLSGDFPVTVVAGISSINAAAARVGLALATRNQAFGAIPATLDESRLESLLAGGDGAAIIKLGRHLAKVRAVIDRLGLTARAFYVERVTQEGEVGRALGDLAADFAAPYFSMILIAPETPDAGRRYE
ncbi:precorrin-2 C(20)-methyltransferase [Varunaivibrio sulfuroxidans]|uniref:Precorrin-2/cobalt-factor-2 C20-methyltransferase n=1 Tax=Varunaivibrio sulfuroxidans TaxID=1773489 RepID=A0A4R3JI08_9PROT|nr:precorrin-2 C(20)-methyltransferase [Varunaivibrio sulfuroxidans]TCS65155.1 precorrin-2/cobalt-factor-2 C20-methyltransferase [Varunaivibrio sulfuroxidans]WES29562.1 precorrin-2 C(20)-methyltransferase [Varunaivibrio sulfuroxidans]